MNVISIIRNILVRVGADIAPLQRNMVQAQRSMVGFHDVMRTATRSTELSMRSVVDSLSMGRLGLVALGAAAVTSFALVGKHAIKSAMDVVESESLFAVSMGSMAGAARQWSNALQDSLGLNAYQVRENVGLFYNMTTSMGLARDQAYQVSTGLTQLAYDMSSFYNQSPAEMFEKLQSGLSGEVEPLKRLGIIVNETTTQNYAYSHGIAAVGTQMTETQKVMARYGAIMEQTKNAQGDLARTIMSPANQLRLLQTQLQLASINLGNAFLPMVQMVLPVLVNFAKGLVLVTNTFAQFMAVLFGTNTAQTQNAQSAADAAVAQTNLGNATKKAGDKAKQGVAGFDQLNMLQESLAASAGDATDALDSGSSVSVPSLAKSDPGNIIPQGVIDAANRFKQALEPLLSISFQPLMDSFGRLKTSLEPFTSTLLSGLKWIYDNILVPLAAWTIQDALPAFLNALAGAAILLNPLLLSLQPLAEWLWTSFLLPIATWTGGVIVETLNNLGLALTGIGTWMTNNQPVVSGMAEAVIGFMGAWKVVELLSFIQTQGGVVAALQAITLAVKEGTVAKLADKAETIALTITNARDLVASLAASTLAFLKQTAQIVVLNTTILASVVASYAHSAAMTVAAAATWLFNAALAVLTSPITLVIAAIALLGVGIYELVTHWDSVKQAASNAWEVIKQLWNQASGWFNNNVVQPIKGLFSGLWDGVKNIFREGANGAIWALETFLNFAIRGFNKLIYGWNMTKSALGISGWTMPIDEIHIPRLAKGGLVSAPTLAMVGDNRNASFDPEVISPLSKLQGMIEQAVSGSMGSGNNAQTSGDLILMVGETELGRVAIKAINAVHRQAGMTLLTI